VISLKDSLLGFLTVHVSQLVGHDFCFSRFLPFVDTFPEFVLLCCAMA